MDNKIHTLIESLREYIIIDEYDNIKSDSWDFRQEGQADFVELDKLFEKYSISMNNEEFISFFRICIGYGIEKDDQIYYIANIRNVIDYLVKEKFIQF